jgi:hypothetical protein
VRQWEERGRREWIDRSPLGASPVVLAHAHSTSMPRPLLVLLRLPAPRTSFYHIHHFASCSHFPIYSPGSGAGSGLRLRLGSVHPRVRVRVGRLCSLRLLRSVRMRFCPDLRLPYSASFALPFSCQRGEDGCMSRTYVCTPMDRSKEKRRSRCYMHSVVCCSVPAHL